MDATPSEVTTPVTDALVQVSFAVLDVLSRSAADFDLSLTQLRLLGILRDRTPTMAELAGFLRLDRSSVSGLIDRAERRELVARRASTEDARVTIVDLAPAGAELGRQVATAVNARIEELMTSVPAAERARFLRLADTIVTADQSSTGQVAR
jgi:DNA-binding MarR family transcriptional regulator